MPSHGQGPYYNIGPYYWLRSAHACVLQLHPNQVTKKASHELNIKRRPRTQQTARTLTRCPLTWVSIARSSNAGACMRGTPAAHERLRRHSREGADISGQSSCLIFLAAEALRHCAARSCSQDKCAACPAIGSLVGRGVACGYNFFKNVWLCEDYFIIHYPFTKHTF